MPHTHIADWACHIKLPRNWVVQCGCCGVHTPVWCPYRSKHGQAFPYREGERPMAGTTFCNPLFIAAISLSNGTTEQLVWHRVVGNHTSSPNTKHTRSEDWVKSRNARKVSRVCAGFSHVQRQWRCRVRAWHQKTTQKGNIKQGGTKVTHVKQTPGRPVLLKKHIWKANTKKPHGNIK